jgi:hypothetical protein
VVEVRLRGVWLYEEPVDACPSETCLWCTGEECNLCGRAAMRAVASSRHPNHPMSGEPVLVGGCEHDVIERHQGTEPPQPAWRFYGAEEFHAQTLRNEKIGDPT